MQESSKLSRRHHAVHIRNDDEVSAMGWDDRLWTRLKNTLPTKIDQSSSLLDSSELIDSNHESINESGQAEDDKKQRTERRKALQYRLGPPLSKTSQSTFQRIITLNGWFGGKSSSSTQPSNSNESSSWLTGSVSYYLHCMFRSDPVILFISMCLSFFGLAFFFSLLIAIAGAFDEECVRVGGEPFNSNGNIVADAFSLSWVTLSTVGYGTSYPALGYQNDNGLNCFIVNAICALESLIGVLYSGFCGAILFGKILRMQSHAQVIFSDPIVIRYGQKALRDTNLDDDDESENSSRLTKCPFPVLEFRIVNRLFKEEGGEILDASLTGVANVNEQESTEEDENFDGHSKNEIFSSQTQYNSLNNSTIPGRNTPTSSFVALQNFVTGQRLQKRSYSSTDQSSSHRGKWNQKQQEHNIHVLVDEMTTSRIVRKHLFTRLEIETCHHPFFKRVWLARHILDQNSPLLCRRVRRQIRKNGNSWPENLNSHEAIRAALHFNQILVSLNGTSNVSASDVCAQKNL